MLPAARAATGDPDSPQAALAALGRLFRAAAADPVLGVRASPAALRQALELGSARAAAALANEGVFTATDRDLLTDLATLAGRLLTAARTAEPSGVAREAGWVLQMLSRELRLALEQARLQVPGLTDGDAPVDGERAVLEFARILAEAARTLPPADPRTSRAAAEAVLDTALRRTLLQLPRDQVAPAALLQGLRGGVARFLAAAEAAASGLTVPVPWTRVAIEVATAMLRDREPPFRLDLFPARRSRTARRRRAPGGNPDRVEPIETSDPDEDAPAPPEDSERPR